MPLGNARELGKESVCILTENVDVSGVMTVALDRDWEMPLMLMTVLESVIVALVSLLVRGGLLE